MSGNANDFEELETPSFAEQLSWHLANGTRPEDSKRPSGVAWGTSDFAAAVGDPENKNVRNWKGKRVLPSPPFFGAIERELFGSDPREGSTQFIGRAKLRAAYDREKSQRDKLAKAARTTNAALADHFSLPPKNLQFIGRDNELRRIHSALNLPAKAGQQTPVRVAIHGLGGVGKTSVALEYAHRSRTDYGGVIWCVVDTRTSLLTTLASLGSALGGGTAGDRNLDKWARAALRWIESQAVPWLLVYDNVTAPDEIRDFLPGHRTKLLITSRFGDWQNWAEPLFLDVPPQDDAVLFFQDHLSSERKESIELLTEKLGRLPLALNHAATYCRQTSTSPQEYARLVERRLAVVPPGVEYSASFLAVYGISLSAARKASESAQQLLELLAFMAADNIPRYVIDDVIMEEESRDGALMALGTSSLVRFSQDQAISIHPLVLLLTRARSWEEGTASTALALVARRMAQLIPKLSLYKSEEWPRLRLLIPHALALFENSRWTTESIRDFVNLAIAVGQLLWTYGARQESEMVYRRALAMSESLLERDDPDVNDALNDLAIVCSNTGKLAEAEELAKEAYQAALQRLGGRHPTVGIRIQVLASVLQKLDKLGEAEEVYRTSVSNIDLPSDRAENYIWRANLAHCLWLQGKFVEAEQFVKEALDYAKIISPQGNEFTGRAYIYLTLVLRDTGRFAEAHESAIVALVMLKTTVGETHIARGWGLAIFASVLLAQGGVDEAMTQIDAALSILSGPLDSSNAWVRDAAAIRDDIYSVRAARPGNQ